MAIEKIKQVSNETTEELQKRYYDTHMWETSTRRGVQMMKYGSDTLIYAEIIRETKPEIIIETGTYKGASAMFLNDTCKGYGLDTLIVTIDVVDQKKGISQNDILYLIGSSTDGTIIDQVRKLCAGKKVMVILDADHAKKHVLEELNTYSPLVTKGQYLIVEDGIVNGHPAIPSFGEGPYEATMEFMKNGGYENYIIDSTKERLLLTQNVSGYLKKIR